MNQAVISILFILIFQNGILAQTPQKLTLQNTVKLALQQSKLIQVSNTKAKIAESKYKQLKSFTIPSIKLNASYSLISPVTEFIIPSANNPIVISPYIPNQYGLRLNVTEPIFVGFRAFAAKEAAKLLMEAAQTDIEKDAAEVKFNAVQMFYGMYKLKSSEQSIKENITLLNTRLQDIKNFLQAGLLTQNDVLKAELQLSNLELSQLEINSNIQILNYNICQLLGFSDNQIIEIDTSHAFINKQLNTVETYIQNAQNNRADLKALKLRKNAAQQNVTLIKGNYYPQIFANANALLARPNPRIIPTNDAFHGTWDVGLTLSFDLTALFTNKNYINEANINVNQLDAIYEQLNEALKMDINQQYNAYNLALQKIKVSEKSLIQANENYRQVSNKFDSQLALTADVLEAAALVLQAKINILTAKADAEVAYYKLLKTSGIEK